MQEERDSFGANLLGRAGLVDTWRAQHPGIVGYTYYSYRFNMREKGKGWRLDYFLVSHSALGVCLARSCKVVKHHAPHPHCHAAAGVSPGVMSATACTVVFSRRRMSCRCHGESFTIPAG